MRLTLVSPGIIQVEEYRNQNIQHIAALQDKKQELLSRGTQRGISWIKAPTFSQGNSLFEYFVPTLLKSHSFQKSTNSSWWNWIFLVELGRYVWVKGLVSRRARPFSTKSKSCMWRDRRSALDILTGKIVKYFIEMISCIPPLCGSLTNSSQTGFQGLQTTHR